MCKHMKNVPEDCCMQCFADNNGLLSNNFFTADMFAKSIAKKIARDTQEKQNRPAPNIILGGLLSTEMMKAAEDYEKTYFKNQKIREEIQLLDMDDFKPDFESTDVKVKLLQL